MFRISKTFEFSAGHSITTLPDSHKCKRPHGHNYSVTVTLASKKLNEHGFVLDYAYLDGFKRYLDEHFDHRVLNEAFAAPRIWPPELVKLGYDLTQSTTAELLAMYFFEYCRHIWPETESVTVCETGKTTATYCRD